MKNVDYDISPQMTVHLVFAGDGTVRVAVDYQRVASDGTDLGVGTTSFVPPAGMTNTLNNFQQNQVIPAIKTREKMT